MKTIDPGAVNYLIKRDLDVIPREAKWLLEAAGWVEQRAAKGELSRSLVDDVINHAESLKLRLARIETLRDVLPQP